MTEKAGWIGFFLGFIAGMVFIALLLAGRNPLDYGRTCNEEDEVAILLARPDGNSRQSACLDNWRVVNP